MTISTEKLLRLNRVYSTRFYILRKIAFTFLYKMPILRVHRLIRPLWNKLKWPNRIDYMLQARTMPLKLVPETAHSVSFTSKCIWNHFYLLLLVLLLLLLLSLLLYYYIFIIITHLFGIIYKTIFYNLNIKLKYWFTSIVNHQYQE